MTTPLLSFTDRGIYCARGDFYIDPWRPVPRAVITHGHSDHARPGHGSYLATRPALPVMRHRLGEISAEGIAFGEVREIGGVSVSFHPAGHIPGSAQVRAAYKDEVWVVSGDYKTTPDGLCEAFEPVPCQHFITECTFGLPVFKWPAQEVVAQEINAWWAQCRDEGRPALLGAYALGKAQRLLHMLDPQIGPILTHGAVEATNAILRGQGYMLPQTTQITAETAPKNHPGALVIAPPGALAGSWAKRFKDASTGFASGWMHVRGIRRRRGPDRGFVVSDHADWDELLRAIQETGAENIYPTHGYTDIFARHLSETGYNAQVVPTEFGGDDDSEAA